MGNTKRKISREQKNKYSPFDSKNIIKIERKLRELKKLLKVNCSN